jgi:predicted neuraminidase
MVRITERTVFDGYIGWLHKSITYRLACGPIIAQTSDETVLTTWLTGSGHEPADDNCIAIARSDDRGKSWSDPQIVVPAGEMMAAHSAFYTSADGRLILIAAYLPTEKCYTEWHYFRLESRDNGHTWSDPIPLVPALERNVNIEKPRAISTGEYMYVGQYFRHRKIALKAPVQTLAVARTEDQAVIMPRYLGAVDAGKFATHRHGVCVFISDRDDGEELRLFGPVENRPLGILEPTCIEVDDGHHVMLCRAEWGGYLWRTESRDSGRTWSDAWQTDIPNPSSKIQLIRLPDDRIALLHNPSGGIVGEKAARDPLAIWISDDGLQTWSVKENVITGGELAYPDAMIFDDKLVFTYDRDRREVRWVEVDL